MAMRREAAQGQLKEKLDRRQELFRNNDELVYPRKRWMSVIHQYGRFSASQHGIEAVKSGCDAYIENPFAETMEDNRAALKAIKNPKKVVRSGHSAEAEPTITRPQIL